MPAYRTCAIGALAALSLLPAASPALAQGAAVIVFAAASLKNALDDANAIYEKRTGTKVAVAYAASPALARQIEALAPADLFISADLEWMDYLQKRGLIKEDTRVNFLSNAIVLVAPADSKVNLAIGPGMPLAQALGNGRLAMADPDAVPAGKYGKAALESLGLWRAVADKIARAENVRAALAFVARGESPLGIVYATDAAVERKVRVVGAFSAGTHPPIVYPAALIAASRSPAAGDLLRFLRSGDARVVFEKYGFTMPD